MKFFNFGKSITTTKEEATRICPQCGAEKKVSEMAQYDGKFVCPECLTDYIERVSTPVIPTEPEYVHCHDCDKRMLVTDAVHHDTGYYCPSCMAKYIRTVEANAQAERDALLPLVSIKRKIRSESNRQKIMTYAENCLSGLGEKRTLKGMVDVVADGEGSLKGVTYQMDINPAKKEMTIYETDAYGDFKKVGVVTKVDGSMLHLTGHIEYFLEVDNIEPYSGKPLY